VRGAVTEAIAALVSGGPLPTKEKLLPTHITSFGKFTFQIWLTAFVSISQQRSIFGYITSLPSHVLVQFLFRIVSSSSCLRLLHRQWFVTYPKAGQGKNDIGGEMRLE
jgi:hypothetical protein